MLIAHLNSFRSCSKIFCFQRRQRTSQEGASGIRLRNFQELDYQWLQSLRRRQLINYSDRGSHLCFGHRSYHPLLLLLCLLRRCRNGRRGQEAARRNGEEGQREDDDGGRSKEDDGRHVSKEPQSCKLFKPTETIIINAFVNI